jgi:nucleotide-binding universal stress UspA family protein
MVIRRVLCPVDFSEFSRRALHHAEAIATWYEAELHVLHVLLDVSPPVVPLMPPVSPPLYSDVKPPIEVLDALVKTSGVRLPVHKIVRQGPAATTIVDCVAEIQADLIVMGTHGRTGFDRVVIGSTAERVVHKARCPVLTVPRGGDEPGSAERVRFTHVLCAMDFSAASLRAMELSLSLAQENAAKLTVLHVIEVLSADEVLTEAGIRVSEYVEKRKQEALERLKSAIPPDARTWCDVTETVVPGRPAHVILREADDRDADLIVMGAQGHSGIALALLGSTTQTVVRRAVCPVLTARG